MSAVGMAVLASLTACTTPGACTTAGVINSVSVILDQPLDSGSLIQLCTGEGSCSTVLDQEGVPSPAAARAAAAQGAAVSALMVAAPSGDLSWTVDLDDARPEEVTIVIVSPEGEVESSARKTLDWGTADPSSCGDRARSLTVELNG